MNTNTILRPSTQLVASVRDELRGRRQARAARRSLERDLATYTSTADVNDLLGAMRGQDGPGVDQVREIVLRNQLRHSLLRAS